MAGFPAISTRFLSKTDGVKINHLISIIDKDNSLGQEMVPSRIKPDGKFNKKWFVHLHKSEVRVKR